jgi:hypothetical protein
MTHRHAHRLSTALVVLLAACQQVKLDPPNKIASVRILATRADQPYARPGATVTMDVLAIDGRPTKAAPMNVYWVPSVCANPPSDMYSACFPALQQALPRGVDLAPLLASGTSFTFRMPDDAIASHLPADGEPYGVAFVFTIACAGHVEYVPSGRAAPDGVPFGCFDDSGVRLGADDFVFAYSRVYAFAARSNQNPVLGGVTFGGDPVDVAQGISAGICTESNTDHCPTRPLDVVVPNDSQELDPSNLDVDGQVLHEQLYVDYYLTGGRVMNDTVVIFDPRAGRPSGTGDEFSAPADAGEYQVWVVAHDNRGGAAWQSFPLHVR